MSDNKIPCANCGTRVYEVWYYHPYAYCKPCYDEGTF